MYEEYVMTKRQINEFLKDIPKLSYNGDKERFKQVVFDGFHSSYLVSTYGRVVSTEYRGVKGRVAVLKPKLTANGYHNLVLVINNIKKTLLVHRLVGLMFIWNPDPENYTQINHMDGNKINNHISNLEWCTAEQNIHHLYQHNLKKNILKGEDITDSKFTERQVKKVCELLEEGVISLKEIAKRTGVSYDMVRNIKSHHSWKHISCNYNIDNYAKYYERAINKRIPLIHEVCKLLESNTCSAIEISERTGVSFSAVMNILCKRDHVNISKLYNIDNYKSRRGHGHKKKGV